MVRNSPQGASSGGGKWFDKEVAWRFSVALLGTAVSLPLIASIIGAPLGIPLLLWSCKPLVDLFKQRAQEQAELHIKSRPNRKAHLN
jgi:hypothetical protein